MPAFTTVAVLPEGYDALAFSCEMPADWVRMPFPAEETDFSNPALFAPLFMVSAPYAAVFFTIAARPKYDDGSVQDWAQFLSAENNMNVERVQEARIGRCPCVLSDATIESEAGVMRSRSVFLEDGGRLFTIGALAPDPIWASVEPMLARMIGSFRLSDVHGLTAPPMREMRADQAIDLTSSADADVDMAETAAPTAAATPATDAASQPDSEEASSEMPDVALAIDPSSLDPENAMNARLRDSGAGLTPRVLEVDLKRKLATVGLGAIEAVVRVPLGWHVIDDGKRALVFDAPGKMQINFNLRPGGPDDHIGILTGIGDELAAANPNAEFMKLTIAGMPCLAIRDLPVDGELLQQAYLVRASRRDELALVCRVTSDDDNMMLAMNTAEVIINSYAEKLGIEA